MQQPQRLALPHGQATRLAAAALRPKRHHVQENIAGGGIRNERHAA